MAERIWQGFNCGPVVQPWRVESLGLEFLNLSQEGQASYMSRALGREIWSKGRRRWRNVEKNKKGG
jgi:hypothetical protein